jgi:hypothetical protein
MRKRPASLIAELLLLILLRILLVNGKEEKQAGGELCQAPVKLTEIKANTAFKLSLRSVLARA